jgi:hypothetical protein
MRDGVRHIAHCCTHVSNLCSYKRVRSDLGQRLYGGVILSDDSDAFGVVFGALLAKRRPPIFHVCQKGLAGRPNSLA